MLQIFVILSKNDKAKTLIEKFSHTHVKYIKDMLYEIIFLHDCDFGVLSMLSALFESKDPS